AARRREIVGLFEIERRDLACIDEGLDVDGLRRLDVGALEVFLVEDDVFVALVLVALYRVLALDVLAALLVVELVAHGREIAAVENVEIQPLAVFRRVKLDRNMNQAETDRAFPDRSWHRRPIR